MTFRLEKNGPIIARRMRAAATPGAFTIVTCRHLHCIPEGENPERIAATASTIKQAFRALASVCDRRGKLYTRGAFAAAIVTPCGRVMTWHEARSASRTI